MKQANHNEVDLLLRSLARGRKGAQWQTAQDTGDVEAVSSAHLDADELNSYAEGMAPAPARARYTEHLADCDVCRGIVTGLSQAAGAANRFEVPEQKGGASFWLKLGAFFSPAFLRFAVPALVLTAVVGIGLLVLRQQPAADRYVAQNERAVAPPSALKETAPALNPTPEVQTKTNSGLMPEPSIESPAKTPTLLDDKRIAELQPEVSASKAGPPKDAGQSIDGTSSEESRRYAGEPKTVAPPPAPATVLDAEKSTELAKEQPAKREDRSRDQRDQDEVFRNETDDVHGPNRSRSNQAPVTVQRGAVMSGRGPSGMDKNKKAAEVETRAVAGRHFAREGDAWVDVAYDSSRALVRVTRGSEQFRALIADEPGVGTIAGQLNGVVIVVWKGRAYRIQ